MAIMTRIGSNRIGTDGEVYLLEATKHQTFAATEICLETASRKGKVRAIASCLRRLADDLDKHADHDAFCADPVLYPTYTSSERITTDLVKLETCAFLDDPLSNMRFRDHSWWSVDVRLKLGFA